MNFYKIIKMKNIIRLTIFLVVIFSLPSFSTKRKVEKKRPEHVQKYIDRFLKVAKNESKKFGIPVSITLAQGILESNSGRSQLSKRHNNHFGVKWYGKGRWAYYTDERPNCRFRVYDTAWESFRDHSILLTTKRYKHLHKLKKTDYKGWAYGLKRAGYATSKSYAQTLIKIIEDFDLDKFEK